ncbi:phosphoglucomutase [Paenibacillus agri]|uniref:Phosphoglucomutase n=1 Tax=Paenibacillus agri TaxID=2744309 RepID=A0A850ELJ6_9BACL|nr:phosphoglucomutase [Paenibacillus agri]NUU61286.1 phosphoglucomutase [Paenibacillus agri]
MGYPDGIDTFKNKLNKKPNGGSYLIEEKLTLVNGVYDGPLAHDNINNQSLTVYSGPRYSGEELRNFTVAFPDDAPWQRMIKIFANANVSEAYVTYETPGDTVEAEDINVLQSGLTAVQSEVERYKEHGRIDGGTFRREV